MKNEPVLKVRFEGPSYTKARIDLSILGSFCENFQALVNNIGQNTLQEPPVGKRGTKPREIKEFCRIELAGFSKGSAVLELALQDELLDFGQEPVRKFLEGYEQIQKDPTSMPVGFDIRVKNNIKAISKMLGSEDRIVYSYRLNGKDRQIVQDKEVLTGLTEPSDDVTEETVEVSGKLMMADFADVECEIHPPFEKIVKCTFAEDLRRLIHLGLERQVVAVGIGKKVKGKENIKLQIKELSIYDDSGNRLDLPDEFLFSSFWTPLDLDAEAQRQGVKPVENYKDLVGGWPEDESFEDFMMAINGEGSEVE